MTILSCFVDDSPPHVSATSLSSYHRLAVGHQRHLRPAIEQSYAQPSSGIDSLTPSLPQLLSGTHGRTTHNSSSNYFDSFHSHSQTSVGFNVRSSYPSTQQDHKSGIMSFLSESFPPHSSHGTRNDSLFRETIQSKMSSSYRGHQQLSRATLRRIYGHQLTSFHSNGTVART